MKIRYKQNFYPVGQGLFYSSSSHVHNTIFLNVIFDCGSEDNNLIKQRIDDYINEHDNEDVDILIISHLHYDHVSGLDYLLKSRNVDTVILPYLSPSERVVLKVYNHKKPGWYINFLSNPYSYLEGKDNVGKVVVINGHNESTDYSVNFPDLTAPFTDNQETKIQILLEEANKTTKDRIEKDEKLKFSGKLSLMSDKGHILLSNRHSAPLI